MIFLFGVRRLLPLLWYLYGRGLSFALSRIVSPSRRFARVGLCAMVYFFSIFPGISFVISCTVDSLSLFGMPGFLLAGPMGRDGAAAVRLLFPLRRCIGSRSWMGFVGSIFTASRAAASCFIWFSRIWSGGTLDSICIACMGVVLNERARTKGERATFPSISDSLAYERANLLANNEI